MKPAPTMPMEVQTKKLPRQEETVILIKPLAHRETHS
jgi:hypothetical protein